MTLTVQKTPAQWPKPHPELGIYETTHAKASTLLKRPATKCLLMVGTRELPIDKTDFYELKCDGPVVFSFNAVPVRRRRYVGVDPKLPWSHPDKSIYANETVNQLRMIVWSTTDSGVRAHHIQKLLDVRAKGQGFKELLYHPDNAAIYGRFLTEAELRLNA